MNNKLNGFNNGISPGDGVGGEKPFFMYGDFNKPTKIKKSKPTIEEKKTRITNFVYEVYQKTIIPNNVLLKSIAKKYGFTSTALDILINLEAIKVHTIEKDNKVSTYYVWSNRFEYDNLTKLCDIVYRNYYEIMRTKWKASKKKQKLKKQFVSDIEEYKIYQDPNINPCKDFEYYPLEKDNLQASLMDKINKASEIINEHNGLNNGQLYFIGNKEQCNKIKELEQKLEQNNLTPCGETIKYESSTTIKLTKQEEKIKQFNLYINDAAKVFEESKKEIKESFEKLAESDFIVSLKQSIMDKEEAEIIPLLVRGESKKENFEKLDESDIVKTINGVLPFFGNNNFKSFAPNLDGTVTKAPEINKEVTRKLIIPIAKKLNFFQRISKKINDFFHEEN